jgi:hypothetical protein
MCIPSAYFSTTGAPTGSIESEREKGDGILERNVRRREKEKETDMNRKERGKRMGVQDDFCCIFILNQCLALLSLLPNPQFNVGFPVSLFVFY